eukprot:363108-Chlamydomonas_euryale.AAC.3
MVGSLADLGVDHPFVCCHASQLQANSPRPGPVPTQAVPALASRRCWLTQGRPRWHHDSHRWRICLAATAPDAIAAVCRRPLPPADNSRQHWSKLSSGAVMAVAAC